MVSIKKIFKDFNRIAIISFSIAIVSVVVGFGINIVLAAWSAPSSTPPLGDIAAPINISDSDQYKAGKLRIGSVGSPGGNALYVDGESVLNGDVFPIDPSFTLGKEGETPWQGIYLDVDSDGGELIEGIHFVEPTIGLRYDSLNDQFDFYKDGVQLSISDKGDITSQGSVSAIGGMNIATDTLTVDAINKRVGIGTTTPNFALDVDSGDVNIVNGKLIVGADTLPSGDSTVYVGRSSDPISTPRAIQVYSDGTDSGIYAHSSSDQSNRAAIEAASINTYGIRASTSTGNRAGIKGYNTSYTTSNSLEYLAPGIIGKNAITFGSGTYGTVENYAKGTGVIGMSAHTNRSRGYIETYGVLAVANTASADSDAESINTYGLYAIEGLEEFGGVSYAGYFDGDVHVEGDLSVGSSGFFQVGTTTSAPSPLDCDTKGTGEQHGRMILDTTNDTLYVCDDSGWSGITYTGGI